MTDIVERLHEMNLDMLDPYRICVIDAIAEIERLRGILQNYEMTVGKIERATWKETTAERAIIECRKLACAVLEGK